MADGFRSVTERHSVDGDDEPPASSCLGNAVVGGNQFYRKRLQREFEEVERELGAAIRRATARLHLAKADL
jgi:hypothetical protein